MALLAFHFLQPSPMLSFLFPLVLLVLVFAPIVLIVYGLIFLRNRRASKRRSPLSHDLLRSPGESLRIEIEDMSLDLMAYLAYAPVFPLLLYSLYLTCIHFGDNPKVGVIATTLYILMGLGALVFSSIKIWKLAKRRNELSLGYEAEVAVAQELNLMAHDGYWIFHDFPAEKFNIDHVVVGPAGIFAVETKGRAKPINDEGKAEWNVEYDGVTLRFPGWQETEPIQQAQRQAKWLQEWLSKAVGEDVSVKGILALPGWYVKRTGSGGIMAYNGKSSSTMLGRVTGSELPEKLIKQLTHQLDQRCRTVKPRAYTPDEKKREQQ